MTVDWMAAPLATATEPALASKAVAREEAAAGTAAPIAFPIPMPFASATRGSLGGGAEFMASPEAAFAALLAQAGEEGTAIEGEWKEEEEPGEAREGSAAEESGASSWEAAMRLLAPLAAPRLPEAAVAVPALGPGEGALEGRQPADGELVEGSGAVALATAAASRWERIPPPLVGEGTIEPARGGEAPRLEAYVRSESVWYSGSDGAERTLARSGSGVERTAEFGTAMAAEATTEPAAETRADEAGAEGAEESAATAAAGVGEERAPRAGAESGEMPRMTVETRAVAAAEQAGAEQAAAKQAGAEPAGAAWAARMTAMPVRREEAVESAQADEEPRPTALGETRGESRGEMRRSAGARSAEAARNVLSAGRPTAAPLDHDEPVGARPAEAGGQRELPRPEHAVAGEKRGASAAARRTETAASELPGPAAPGRAAEPARTAALPGQEVRMAPEHGGAPGNEAAPASIAERLQVREVTPVEAPRASSALRIQVAGERGEEVQATITATAGGVQVRLRTAESGLSQAMEQGAPLLRERLEEIQSARAAEPWDTAAVGAEAGMGTRAAAESGAQSGAGQENAGRDPDAAGEGERRQEQPGGERRRRDPEADAEDFDAYFQAGGKR